MNNIVVMIGALGIIIAIILILVIQQRSALGVLKKKYDFFTKGKEINIDQTLMQTLKELEATKKELQELKAKHEALREQVKGCLQTVKVKRYDAYEAMGGELSYSILITDEKHDGLILTSIYGREDNRCYAKEVIQGKAKTALSKEEQQLL